MIKKLWLSLCLSSGIGFVYSQERVPTETLEVPEHQTRELITDNTFKRRFYNHPLGDTTFTSTIGCSANEYPTVWNVAEWNSHSSFLNMQPDPTTGMCRFANNYKDFRFGGPSGIEEYDIYFAVNSSSEYNNVYRNAGEPWPHLLVEQRLSPPYDHAGQGPGCPWLNMLKSLTFKIDAKLYYNQTIIKTGYNSSLHAAQFLVYFTVQNLNPSSAGYGKYIWLGVPLYDDRVPFVPGSLSYDVGTHSLVKTIPYQDFASTSLHNGTWVSVDFNILPYAIQALQAAWSQGVLTQSTNLADYKIGGMNMGWELPGLNISTMVVKNLHLIAKTNEIFWGLERTSNYNEENGSISIFPNPVSTNSVSFSAESIQSICIVDYLGKVVAKLENIEPGRETVPVDISSLPQGIYFSFVMTQNGIKKGKFLKE